MSDLSAALGIDQANANAAKYAASLNDEKSANQALWTSTISSLHNELYGDGTSQNPGLLNQFSSLQNKLISEGNQSVEDAKSAIQNYQSTYTPLYQSLVNSAQTASSQLSQLAGTSLGTSKSYTDQLKLGTSQLNARLSAQGLLGSSAGNAQYANFAQNLGAQEEANRQNLLTGISNTGLQAASGLQSSGATGVQLLNNAQQNNINTQSNLATAGANLGMQAAGTTAYTNLGLGSQGINQQQISAGLLSGANQAAASATALPFQVLGTAGGIATKAALL